MATTLDGEALAARLRDDLRESVERLADDSARPGLATVHAGDEPAAESYVQMKQRDCEEVGIEGTRVDIDPTAPASELHDTIADLNADPSVHGVLIQDDVPEHVDWRTAIRRIDPEKDVDGLHPDNVGRLLAGAPRFVPCTPLGIRRLLAEYDIDIAGANVVVVNRSMIVGKPLAALLGARGGSASGGADATVTICHSRTEDLAAKTRAADVLVVAVDRPRFLDGSMVTEGTTVVDVGIGRVPAESGRGYELVGDVDAASVELKVDYFAPVPGGVGPMTRVMLLRNTVRAARRQTDAPAGE
ncbi:bifunctional 5,10-methylenetetrahydrofolate dehydrogenase/5,10-methenyltetrahydrofolate cyclohydrolase [Halosimplex halophilum]|uniref:bifunctional 5,10-methylenetetrahydrofolate dehydrogenase/5,10-methenyltetrahydrofolate cyclohydrolase n=1 Tax=Halosimplex halophilum TaxID=2559572 RepID=UPI00107F267C|nr:tetrahydrofolate dehydrogenase/cyclohydrolase catalytic domain-containing protein [Halosimplex halophilum]